MIKELKALLKRDFLYGYRRGIISYLCIAILFFMFNYLGICNLKIINMYSSDNLFLQMFSGAPYYENLNELIFPTMWILINSFIFFIIGSYVSEDIKNNGIYLFTRCRKNMFLLSKVVWSFINIIIYYLIIFGITLLMMNIFKGNSNGLSLIDASNNNIQEIFAITIILYVTTTISMSLIYMTMSIITKPKYAFLAVLVILISSVFIQNSLMPGQHSLILRNAPFDTVRGLTVVKSILYNLITSITMFIIAEIVLLKKDIY